MNALVTEIIVSADSAPMIDPAALFSWRPTVSARFNAFRRALSQHELLARHCASVLEDSLGRLHLWLPSSLTVLGIDLVQRLALAHALQCLARDDGEWIRAVSLGVASPLVSALDALASHQIDWMVLEAGPRERWFVQVGPRGDDGWAQAELVSNRFLGELSHSRSVRAQLLLLRWSEPDPQHSDLHHRRIDVSSSSARRSAAEWLWRSWSVAFGARSGGDETIRLRTLSS